MSSTHTVQLNANNLRVTDQNGISQAWYIVEIYHSGREPSNYLKNGSVQTFSDIHVGTRIPWRWHCHCHNHAGAQIQQKTKILIHYGFHIKDTKVNDKQDIKWKILQAKSKLSGVSRQHSLYVHTKASVHTSGKIPKLTSILHTATNQWH